MNKNDNVQMPTQNLWQPTSPLSHLVERAKIIQSIRQFFYDRNILEVETPILSQAAVTDVYLDSFHTHYYVPGDIHHQCGKKLSLITSPEYHMKRLIAAGMGAIFQIVKCFRNQECGRYHNPEFTMLEWYRPKFEMNDLIDEVDELLRMILKTKPAHRISYHEAFKQYLNIDLITANDHYLLLKAKSLNINFDYSKLDRDALLQGLFTFGIEPFIGQDQPTVIYHFPSSQAALAEICIDNKNIAKRFEFYYRGVELANGFKELTCAKEQRRRFENDNVERKNKKYDTQQIDELFLASLNAGMPPTSGVAIGLDRLIMLAIKAENLSEVISFNIERA